MADDFWEEFGDFIANIDWGSLGEATGQAVAAYAIASAFSQQKKISSSGLVSLPSSVPPKTVFVGDYSRSAGVPVFKYSSRGWLHDVRAFSDGRLDSIAGVWLHDDKVSLSGSQPYSITGVTNKGAVVNDGRYVDNRIFIEWRLGTESQTAYSSLVSEAPTLWTSNHKGNGVGHLYMVCFAPKPQFFRQAFPNHAPDPTIAARGVCYDWRKDSTQPGGSGSQRRNDPTTWAWSANPVVWLVHLEWYRWGMDWARRIAPVLADLTTEANICDEPVALKAGGTEPRYRVAFNYQPANTRREDVRRVLLDSMAGTYGRNARGHLIIRAGKYRTPTVTIDQQFIVSHEFASDIEADEFYNEFQVTVIDPNLDYNEVELLPMKFGGGGRPTSLKFEGVYSQTQGQRLAKIHYYRNRYKVCPIAFTDRGLSVLGEQFVNIKNPDWDIYDDIVVEPVRPSVVSNDFTVAMGYRRVFPEAWDWDAATEEQSGITAPDFPDVSELVEPEIDSVSVVGTALQPRLLINATGPDLDSLTWVLNWRVTGEDTWISESFTDFQSLGSGQVSFTSSIVEAVASLDIRIQYVTAGANRSPFSDIEVVDTSVPVTTLATPTGLSLSTPGPNTILVQGTSSSSSGSLFTDVYRNTTDNFGTAVMVSRVSTAPSQSISVSDTGRTSSTTYYYWLRASGINALSAPTTSQSIVAT